MRTTKLTALALALPLALPFLATGTAHAATGTASANLVPVPLNGSSANGTAMVSVDGTTLNVAVDVSDILADQPHAMHIHFGADAAHECPTAAADTDGSGRINTTEGGPAYGPVTVSLTTSGDTSADSTLAVDRFPTAPGGSFDYARGSIEASPEVAQAIVDGQAVVVVHGNDYNGNGEYDMEGAGASELDASLPAEATDPNICGLLVAAPAGGAATGGGGTADVAMTGTEIAALGLGAALLLGTAGGAAAVAGRRTRGE